LLMAGIYQPSQMVGWFLFFGLPFNHLLPQIIGGHWRI
jgi:hypothetical protein